MKKILSAILVCVLMVGCVLTLVSCGGPNKDYKEAVKALEDADYEVYVLEGDAAAALFEGCEAMVTASNEDEKGLMIYYFKDADSAADAYDKIEEQFNAMKDLAEEMDEEFDYKLKRAGSMIWYGDKEAIKAAK